MHFLELRYTLVNKYILPPFSYTLVYPFLPLPKGTWGLRHRKYREGGTLKGRGWVLLVSCVTYVVVICCYLGNHPKLPG